MKEFCLEYCDYTGVVLLYYVRGVQVLEYINRYFFQKKKKKKPKSMFEEKIKEDVNEKVLY